MKITALKEQAKNLDRVNVFVDEKYSFSLTIAEVVDYKVRVGIELDEAGLEALKKASTDGKTRMRAYEWLMNRPHSSRELRDYLRRKKVEPELVEKLTGEFIEKGVLSDQRFAEWFSERAVRKNKSSRMMQSELRGKGIDQVTIQSIVTEQGSSSGADQDALANLIAKLSSRSRYADQKKLIAYLLSKGFSYSDVKDALKLRETELEQEP